MTLAELRNLLKLHVFDDSNTLLTNERARVLLNIGMHYAASIAISVRPELFLTSVTLTISNPSEQRIVLADLNGLTPWTRSAGVVRAEALNVGNTQTVQIRPIHFKDIDLFTTESPMNVPAIFNFNETFGFTRPADGLIVRVWYYAALNDMTSDSDTPGQSGGIGTPNIIPQEYQMLIPAYAAMLAMASSNLDTSGWERIIADMRSVILARQQARTAPEAGLDAAGAA